MYLKEMLTQERANYIVCKPQKGFAGEYLGRWNYRGESVET
jgi:hypothetical protein